MLALVMTVAGLLVQSEVIVRLSETYPLRFCYGKAQERHTCGRERRGRGSVELLSRSPVLFVDESTQNSMNTWFLTTLLVLQ